MQGIKTDWGLKALIAQGGGGSALTIQEEGGVIDAATTTINFVGASVTASQTAPGVVKIDATDLNSNVANANLVMDGDHTVEFCPGEEERWELKFFGGQEDTDNICRWDGPNATFSIGNTPATEYVMPTGRAISDGQMLVSNSTDSTFWRFPWNVYDVPNDHNVLLGIGALSNIDPSAGTGQWNVALGKDVGSNISNGSFNTIVGSEGGGGLQTGECNTLIGFDTQVASGTNNAICIGAQATASSDGEISIGSAAYTVGPVTASVATASTHKVAITINGVQYYLLVTT